MADTVNKNITITPIRQRAYVIRKSLDHLQTSDIVSIVTITSKPHTRFY